MPAETKSMIAVARRPVDPVIAELDQWQVRNLHAVNDAVDATLAELHHTFDQATVARARVADITQQQRPPCAKPKPAILDTEVALVHELADLVTVASRLHHPRHRTGRGRGHGRAVADCPGGRAAAAPHHGRPRPANPASGR
jgi:predicted Zn-dependent protease